MLFVADAVVLEYEYLCLHLFRLVVSHGEREWSLQDDDKEGGVGCCEAGHRLQAFEQVSVFNFQWQRAVETAVYE